MIKISHKGPNEEIVLVLRRHGVIMFKNVTILLLGAIVPVVLYFIIQNAISSYLDTDSFLYIFLVLLGSLYYLFIWLFFFHAWVDYYLDVWIVTNERIISIEQEGLFSHVMSEQRLFRVQDVTSETKGAWASFFHYGNVYIQTAGEQQRFIFEQVPRPYEVSRKILELHDKDVIKSQELMKAEEKLEEPFEDTKPEDPSEVKKL